MATEECYVQAQYEVVPSANGVTSAHRGHQPSLTPPTDAHAAALGHENGPSDGAVNAASGAHADPRLRLVPDDLAGEVPRPGRGHAEEFGRVLRGLRPDDERGAANGHGQASTLAERIVATTGEALLVLDGDFRVRQTNPAYDELFRLTPEQSAQQDFFALGGGQWDARGLGARLLDVLSVDSRLEDFAVEGDFPTVGRRTMVLNGRRLTSPDGEALVLLTIHDTTDSMATEQERRDFILLLAHELKNPLTTIMGYVQFAQRPTADREEALAVIMTQAEHLNRLIEDILAVSTRGAAQLRLTVQRLDLAALASASVQQVQHLSPARTVRLEVPNRPIFGLWDGSRLSQVFANLLGNAIKYSSAGSEVVMRLDEHGAAAHVSVQDQGRGISPDDFPRLFDRFYRVSATAHKMQGLGIGLHVVKTLVAAHGGSVSVESVLGLGSTFRVTLPMVPPPPAPPASAT